MVGGWEGGRVGEGIVVGGWLVFGWVLFDRSFFLFGGGLESLRSFL